MKNGRILAFGAALAVSAGGFVLTATPASAEQVVVHATDIPTRVIRYADLDLTDKIGQKQLKRRVGTAVFDVCDGSASYATFQSEGFCQTAAWSQARPQMARAIERAQLLASLNVKDTEPQAITISL